MDRNDYVEKCEEMLKSKQFVQLENDPTTTFERKVQDKLRELKKKKRFTAVEYRKIYPSSSRPGRFYATAKRHKVAENCTDPRELPLRPIVTNIGTASYGISKHLAKLLQPLSVSEYTIGSTKAFVERKVIGRLSNGTLRCFKPVHKCSFGLYHKSHSAEDIQREIDQDKIEA